MIELIARLYVAYLAPQNDVADLINSDLTFVGEPERHARSRRRSAPTPEARKASVKPASRPTRRHLPLAALRRMCRTRRGRERADRHGRRPARDRSLCALYPPDAPPYTSAHEVTHLYQSDAFRALGRLSRGLTHVFADEAVADRNTGQ